MHPAPGRALTRRQNRQRRSPPAPRGQLPHPPLCPGLHDQRRPQLGRPQLRLDDPRRRRTQTDDSCLTHSPLPEREGQGEGSREDQYAFETFMSTTLIQPPSTHTTLEKNGDAPRFSPSFLKNLRLLIVA